MTSKERVIAALHHREADRVPRGENAFDNVLFKQICGYDTLCFSGWEEKEVLWAGGRDKVISDYVDGICTMAETLHWDFVRVPPAPKKMDYSGFKRTGEHTYIDNNGVSFHYNPKAGNVAMCEHFNTDMTEEDLGDENAPFSVDDSEMDIVRGVKARIGDTHFIVARNPIGGTFPYISTVGLEEFLIRMITDPDFIHKAAKIASRQAVIYAKAFIDAGCDGILVAEDYADARGLIMGKDRYEEFILPYLRSTCQGVHSAGGYFIKHTDGVMWDALDSFVDVGVDAWHGIQPRLGMDFKILKEKYAGKLCLFGGVNVESLFDATEEEIRQEVRTAIRYAAPGGGYVLTSGNILAPGTKPNLYLAAMQEADRISLYPVKV